MSTTMRNRVRIGFVALVCVGIGLISTSCDFSSSGKLAGVIAFGGYSSGGSTFKITLDDVDFRHQAGLIGGSLCTVTYQWTVPAYDHESGRGTNVFGPACASGVTTTLTIPARAGGGSLWLRSTGKFFAADEMKRDKYAWTELEIPAYAAPTPAAPTVRVFAHASPAGDERTLLDARLSTGSGALTYAWSPSQCAGASYLSGDAVPAGTSLVAYGYTGDCTVTVTDASVGASASTKIAVESRPGLHNGSFAFGGSSTVTVNGGSGGFAVQTRACVDLTGTDVYSTEVALAGTNPSTGTVTLTALTQGMHQIGATLWAGTDNAGCTNTGSAGAIQVIKDLYTVDGTGAARRGLRTASFVAPSSLRFVSSKTVSEGTYDTTSGVITGATTSGSFAWSTPAAAKGVKRPAGAAKLAKGTYVMRSIDMAQGPSVGNASTLLGTGTVLLRGTDGTLACGTLAGGFDSSALTLSGGTRSARTLAGTVTGKQVTYVFPTPAAAAASRSGGVSGMLATALGWIAGDQPSERAKKPGKKPKQVKVRPVKASGTASLQTAAKATGLPASCKALVQYLPQ